MSSARNQRLLASIALLIIFCLCLQELVSAKSSRDRKSRSKGKTVLPFHNINIYSLSGFDRKFDAKGARITKASHFIFNYRLGYKIWLICIAEGNPLPVIQWFKDSVELPMNSHTHISENVWNTTTPKIGKQIQSRIELDPATVGDAGVYTCMANNNLSVMIKNFKADYFL